MGGCVWHIHVAGLSIRSLKDLENGWVRLAHSRGRLIDKISFLKDLIDNISSLKDLENGWSIQGALEGKFYR
jgi:hypothetical protein